MVDNGLKLFHMFSRINSNCEYFWLGVLKEILFSVLKVNVFQDASPAKFCIHFFLSHSCHVYNQIKLTKHVAGMEEMRTRF